MTDDNSDISLSDPVDEIDDYIEKNSHILTLVSVFAALAVYVSSVAPEETGGAQGVNITNLAAMAGLSISAFLIIIAIFRILQRILESRSPVTITNLFLGIFGSLLLILLISIGRLTILFEDTVLSITNLSSEVMGIFLFGSVLYYFDDLIVKGYMSSENQSSRFISGFVFLLCLYIISNELSQKLLRENFGSNSVEALPMPTELNTQYIIYQIIEVLGMWKGLASVGMISIGTILLVEFTSDADDRS